MNLLTLFALPVATIILAIVIEKILRSPIHTAATFFAIYLIVAFAAFDESFLIFVIIYILLAYIAAVIAEIFYSRCRRKKHNCCCDNDENNNTELSNELIQNIAARVSNILNSENDSQNNNCNCNNTATSNIRNGNGNRTTWCCKRIN